MMVLSQTPCSKIGLSCPSSRASYKGTAEPVQKDHRTLTSASAIHDLRTWSNLDLPFTGLDLLVDLLSQRRVCGLHILNGHLPEGLATGIGLHLGGEFGQGALGIGRVLLGGGEQLSELLVESGILLGGLDLNLRDLNLVIQFLHLVDETRGGDLLFPVSPVDTGGGLAQNGELLDDGLEGTAKVLKLQLGLGCVQSRSEIRPAELVHCGLEGSEGLLRVLDSLRLGNEALEVILSGLALSGFHVSGRHSVGTLHGGVLLIPLLLLGMLEAKLLSGGIHAEFLRRSGAHERRPGGAEPGGQLTKATHEDHAGE
mmetsp:Transcript_32894/g.75249  ORF Transcript_32894/g.75249 Transcript_32894/m.75249 type:complete len:313 (-) Transcript_32894:8-946(-)